MIGLSPLNSIFVGPGSCLCSLAYSAQLDCRFCASAHRQRLNPLPMIYVSFIPPPRATSSAPRSLSKLSDRPILQRFTLIIFLGLVVASIFFHCNPLDWRDCISGAFLFCDDVSRRFPPLAPYSGVLATRDRCFFLWAGSPVHTHPPFFL